MATDPSYRETEVSLDQYDNNNHYERGVPFWKEVLWQILQALFVSSWLPGTKHRVYLLRLFGAKIGHGVVLKPRIRVKCPWRLKIGNYSWVGESCWIDNPAKVSIGDHCCLSQGSYLCTGSHDWSVKRFDLILQPIKILEYVWIAAFARVGPGVIIGEGAVLSLGSVATKDLEAWKIYVGTPCRLVKERKIGSAE